jgi:hypothetical protein
MQVVNRLGRTCWLQVGSRNEPVLTTMRQLNT